MKARLEAGDVVVDEPAGGPRSLLFYDPKNSAWAFVDKATGRSYPVIDNQQAGTFSPTGLAGSSC